MNDISVNQLTLKYSTVALSIIIGVVQFIQCNEKLHEKHGHEREILHSNEFMNREGPKMGISNNNNHQNPASRDFAIENDITGASSTHEYMPYHRKLYNTSWAVTIPLYTFLFPTDNTGNPLTLGNQALYGFFAAVIVIISFAFPILYNGDRGEVRSLNNYKMNLDHLMHPAHITNLGSVSLQNQIGFDPVKCLQKSVCEANRYPQNQKYGILAMPFQYFFPAKNVSDMEAKNIYEISARDGKYTEENCGRKYECMIDVLDLANYFFSAYKRSRPKPEEVALDIDDSNFGSN